jgi:hypothetical protein
MIQQGQVFKLKTKGPVAAQEVGWRLRPCWTTTTRFQSRPVLKCRRQWDHAPASYVHPVAGIRCSLHLQRLTGRMG